MPTPLNSLGGQDRQPLVPDQIPIKDAAEALREGFVDAPAVGSGNESPGGHPGAGPDWPMNRLRDTIAAQEKLIDELKDNVGKCAENIETLDQSNREVIKVVGALSTDLREVADQLKRNSDVNEKVLDCILKGNTPAILELNKLLQAWMGSFGQRVK